MVGYEGNYGASKNKVANEARRSYPEGREQFPIPSFRRYNELKEVLRDQFLELSYIFSTFFLLSNFFLLFWFWKQLPKLVLSLRSFLSCFQHSRTNHCPYLGTSKLYFMLFFCCRLVFIVLVFGNNYQTCFFSSLRSLLSCFQHSRTNHCPYLRTKQIILSRSITFSAFFFVRNLFLSLRSLLSCF